MSDNQLPPRPAQYLNARVTVNYGGQAVGYSDTGRLTHLDGVWVEVTKANGDRLLIPVASIRHIKLLEVPRQAGDVGTLLRGSSLDAQNALE